MRGRAGSPRLERVVPILLVVVAAALGASFLGLTVLHADDRYGLNATSSVWLGLTEAASRSVLYPPLYEDGYVAGTRYMPLPVVLFETAHRITGEFLVSSRFVGLLSVAGLAMVMLAVLRSLKVAAPVAAAVTAVTLTTEVGISSVAGVRPEALPTVLQLAAVAVIARGGAAPVARGPLLLAAVLSVLAVLSKFTALFAPVAIVLWLLPRDRRATVWFATAFVALAALCLGGTQVATDGRFAENLRALGATSPSLANIATIPASVLNALARSYGPFLLLPFAIASFARVHRWRALSIYQLSLVAASAVTVVVFTDLGASYNHLLDLVVLAGIVAAAGWPTRSALLRRSLAARPVAALLGIALLVGGVATFVTTVGIDFVLAARQEIVRREQTYDPAILDRYVRDVGPVLADDAWVPLSIGQRPIVLDWYALYRLAQRHPEWLQRLADRAEAREFGAIVLQYDIDDPDRRVPDQSGPIIPEPVLDDAIRSHYRLVATVRTPSVSYGLATPLYYVYHPR